MFSRSVRTTWTADATVPGATRHPFSTVMATTPTVTATNSCLNEARRFANASQPLSQFSSIIEMHRTTYYAVTGFFLRYIFFL